MKEKNKKEEEDKRKKPKSQDFDFDLISQYAHYKEGDQDFHLNEKTIIDLDFHSYYKYIDRTHSAVGQQLLYYKLVCQSAHVDDLEDQEKSISFYKSNAVNKSKSQAILKKLSKSNDYYFPYLIFSELPKPMYKNWIIVSLQIATLSCVFLSFLYPIFFLPTVLLFTINLCLHYLHKNRIGNFTTYFSRLTNLSCTIRKIIPFSNLAEGEKSALQEDAKHIDNITKKILFLKTDNLQNSEVGSIIWFVFELLKIITLSEVTTFNKLILKIDSSKTQIENIFLAIGKIDIAISISSLRDGLPYYSIPYFEKNEKKLKVEKLYHPLITDCVSNDIALLNKSLLLTGSNMAGKSTFIKAVNLNAITSQVLNTSFASYYSAPVWRLATSMTIKDNLNEKSSYYMEEVYSIGNLINCSKDLENIYLFTIDEIFKGTNTIERISTAKSILEFLNSGHHLVLVSTHDIELTKLLQEGFDLYFFQEGIKDQVLSFDYKVKKGSLKESNAIKILEIAGYPASVTTEARRLALKIKDEKTGHLS